LPLRWTATSQTFWLCGLLFFGALSVLAINRHHAFATGRHDLEIYAQVVWNTANGAPYATTLLRTNTLHLAEHLALVLLPLAPLYGALPDPRLLLLIQQATLATAALAIGFFARRRLGDAAGLVVLACCLLSPVLAAIALDDFHAVVLTTLPIAVGLVLALVSRPRCALLSLLAAALMEEEAALALAGLGLLMLVRRPRLLGAGGLVAAAIILSLAAGAIMPSFHDPRTINAGGTRTAGHFSAVSTAPGVVIERLLGRRGQNVFLSFVVPTAGLPFLSPTILPAGLPTFVALFLQDRDDTYTRHWAAPIIPAVWLAAVGGLAVLHGRARQAGLTTLIIATCAAYLFASPLPGGGAFVPAQFARSPREAALERALGVVPPDAPTVVSGNLAAHLANRRHLYIFPVDEQYASQLGYESQAVDAYVLDFADRATSRVAPLAKDSPLTASPPFVMQSAAQKVLVLTRSASPPERPLTLLWGRGMALRGYDLSRSRNSFWLTFHWERVAGISADFRRSVELLDGSGRVVAEHSDFELTRTLPTNKWQVGQQVRDEVELDIPAASNSDFRVRIQWHNRDQNRPILLQNGATSAEIQV
jgi:uncharacterized membrane protein